MLVALLLPTMLFGWGWAKLQRPPRATGKAAGMERKLRGQRPEVIVLGSSLARTNVESELLAQELGLNRKNVTMMTLPNATAAHWYAIMKNRVFANGHRPKAVIMVGALTTMITPDVLMDSNIERLVNQLSDDEPVIGKKVFGTLSPSDFRYLYMREQAGQIRDDMLVSYRDWALGLLFGSHGKSVEGRRLADRANEIVFADENMDYGLHGQGGGLWGGAVEEIDLSGVDVGQDSLVPDIGELARAYGAYAVFVRTPFPPSNSDNDLVEPDLERETVEVMESAEAGYIDLRSLNLDDSYFQDMRHMSRDGAVIFTKALAKSILSMGLLERKGKAEVRTGLNPTAIERVGTPPRLSGLLEGATQESDCAWLVDPGVLSGLDTPTMTAAGQSKATPIRVRRNGEALPWLSGDEPACTPGVWFDGEGLHIVPNKKGDLSVVRVGLDDEVPFDVPEETLPAWWVYPGNSLTFTFEDAWRYEEEAFRTFLLGHVFGGDGGRAELLVNGEPLQIDVLGNRAWLAGTPTLPTTTPWTLEVRSPDDGPFVMLQNLAVGAMPNTSHLIGLPELLTGASIRLVGGKVEDTQLDPEYLTEPPKLNMSVRVRKAPRGLGMISVPAFAALADAPTSRASIPHKCSPIRILESGSRLPEPHSVCLDVANLKGGKSCHAGNVIYFSALDSSLPNNNGKRYTLELDETRVCDRRNQRNTTPLRGVLWMYPSDHLRLDFPEDKLADFYDGANRLEVEVESPIVREGDLLDMRLYADGEVWHEARIEPPGNRRSTETWTFEPPIPPRTRDVRLEFRNASQKSYWLVLMATLSEDYDYGFSPARAQQAAVEEYVDNGDMFGEGGGEDPFGGSFEETESREPTGLVEPISSQRLGEMPVLPPMKHQKRTPQGVVEGHLFSLWPVSNSVLVKRGLEWWSPISVHDGDTELKAAASRKDFLETCGECFVHYGQLIASRPPTAKSADALTVGLRPEFPTETPAGRDIWWVYPTTGAELELPAWEGESVHVRVLAQTFTNDKNNDFTPPYIQVGESRAFFEPAGEGWEATLDVIGRQQDSWKLQVHVPPGGPFLILEEVDYEDEGGLWRAVERPIVHETPTVDEVWE
jgi:hypothetical protein